MNRSKSSTGGNANSRQIGGAHYKKPIEHWDIVAIWNLDYFQGIITKYVMRWREKGGIQDLEKGLHSLAKYIEVEQARAAGTLTPQLLQAALAAVQQYLPGTPAVAPAATVPNRARKPRRRRQRRAGRGSR